jgi:hypothetical protein
MPRSGRWLVKSLVIIPAASRLERTSAFKRMRW